MGWFDEQIEYRKKRELDLLSDSFQNIAKSITGHKIGEGWIDEGADIKDALSQLLKYFNVKGKEVPAKYKEFDQILEYQFSNSGIMYREVELSAGWSKDAMGAMMTTLEDGSVIALIPGRVGGFDYIDPKTSKLIHVNSKIEKSIGTQAYCFYRPFPNRAIQLKDVFLYMKECLTSWDYTSFVLSCAIVTLIGMLMPKLSQILTGYVVDNKSLQLLVAVMVFMFCVTISSTLFGIIRQLLLTRINIKMNVNVSAATMMRVLSLPASFFKDYSAGELNQYLTYMNSLCSTIVDSFLSTGLTGLFSLVYITQIFGYAKYLVVPSLIVTFVTLLISMISAMMQMAISKERMMLVAKEKGLTYSLISGIQKIRLAGAENRAFSKWANLYSQEASLEYNPPAMIKLNTVFVQAVSMIGTIVMYYVAVQNHIRIADYYAFNAAYAYISTAFASLASVGVSIGTIRPILDLIKPLMDAQPEIEDGKETVTSLSGNIEFSHVSFRYDADAPYIIEDMNLIIQARQYVAIVGKTGCGKSTLMRLLLGFETPTRGTIFFDRKDSKRLDIKSIRKNIGTVMQDGKLFGGSLFENITISNPSLTLDDAWKAAEIAGMKESIEKMPMGMNTMVQEGGGGISGGQRQRLLIARAVATKPKILLLDEATSALDNITQKNVSDALDKMRCTRIVIAHRLSTIRHCDRILVLDGGRIVEDGTYDQLIEKNGLFAELVERQRIGEKI